MHADACSTDGLGSIGPLGSHKWLVPTTSFYLLTYLIHQGLDRDELRPDTPMTNSTPVPLRLSSSRPSRARAPGAGSHTIGKHG